MRDEATRLAARETVRRELDGVEFANDGHRSVAELRLTEMLLSFVREIDRLNDRARSMTAVRNA